MKGLGSELRSLLPAGKGQGWRLSAPRAPGGPAGPAGLATSAAPARGPQGRSWGGEGGPTASASAGGRRKLFLRARSKGLLAATQSKKSWARIDVCAHRPASV